MFTFPEQKTILSVSSVSV